MNVDFEALSQIPQLIELVMGLKTTLEAGTIEKRWLSTSEMAEYTPYTKNTIEAKVKSKDLVRGIHYHKKDGKLVYDKYEIDKWLMGISPANNSSYQENSVFEITDEILASIAS